MRKRLLSIILVVSITLLAGLFFHSCEEEDCADCKQIRTDTDGIETTQKTVTACDEELAGLESEDPVTIGGVTTKWVCE